MSLFNTIPFADRLIISTGVHGVLDHINPHTDMRGPHGPQNTLLVAPTAIIGTHVLNTSKLCISFIPDHTVFGIRWTPHIQKCEFFCKSL